MIFYGHYETYRNEESYETTKKLQKVCIFIDCTGFDHDYREPDLCKKQYECRNDR